MTEHQPPHYKTMHATAALLGLTIGKIWLSPTESLCEIRFILDGLHFSFHRGHNVYSSYHSQVLKDGVQHGQGSTLKGDALMGDLFEWILRVIESNCGQNTRSCTLAARALSVAIPLGMDTLPCRKDLLEDHLTRLRHWCDLTKQDFDGAVMGSSIIHAGGAE